MLTLMATSKLMKKDLPPGDTGLFSQAKWRVKKILPKFSFDGA